MQKAFDKPLPVVVDKLRLLVDPSKLATPYVTGAIGHARSAKSGTSVPLVVSVKGAAVRAWAQKLAKRINREPAEVGLTLRDGKPFIAPRAFGRRLDQAELVQRVVHALSANTRLPVHGVTSTLQPRSLASGSSAVVVIDRGREHPPPLQGHEAVAHVPRRHRPVGLPDAAAAASTSSSSGRTRGGIRRPHRGPRARPRFRPAPATRSARAGWASPRPASASTARRSSGSIGYSESHGCIRMLIPEAEWLFEHVDVGTTVFIV